MITSYKDFVLGKNLYRLGPHKLIYCRFKYRGKEYRRATGKVDLKLAQKAAWTIYAGIAGINDEKVEYRRSVHKRLSEIGQIYMSEISKAGKCSAKSARNNFAALKNICAACNLPDPTLDELTPELITKWREKCYKKRGKVFGEDYMLDLNLTLNSNLRQAKSVFSQSALQLYKNLSIKIPKSIEEFKGVQNLKQMTVQFIPIDKNVDLTIKTALYIALRDKLPSKLTSRWKDLIPSKKIAVAVQLARLCGLTVKEIQNIRWEWFESRNGKIILSIRNRIESRDGIAWESKGNKKNRDLEISAKTFLTWKKALCSESDFGYLFNFNNATQRLNFVARDVSNWVRQFLPNRTKTLHELRKQAGSEVATEHGIYSAAKFLGDSVRVAEMYYASLLHPVKAL